MTDSPRISMLIVTGQKEFHPMVRSMVEEWVAAGAPARQRSA